jgi:hypothetical protein
MIRLAADENFDNDILRGLYLQYPDLDLIWVQDTEMFQKDDPTVLGWLAKEVRILLTHDVKTMPNYAYQRVKLGLPMFGVIIVRKQMPVGQAIEELLTILGASEASEWENRVVFLPL